MPGRNFNFVYIVNLMGWADPNTWNYFSALQF